MEINVMCKLNRGINENDFMTLESLNFELVKMTFESFDVF